MVYPLINSPNREDATEMLRKTFAQAEYSITPEYFMSRVNLVKKSVIYALDVTTSDEEEISFMEYEQCAKIICEAIGDMFYEYLFKKFGEEIAHKSYDYVDFYPTQKELIKCGQ